MIERKLTPKQQAFADYYIELGNATEAAVKAGYSKKTAKEIGSENLTKPNISAYIEERMKELQSERIADATEVLEALTSVLRGEKQGTALVGMGMGEQDVVQVEPTVAEKIKAAELLGKRYKLWTDKQEVEHSGGMNNTIDLSGLSTEELRKLANSSKGTT